VGLPTPFLLVEHGIVRSISGVIPGDGKAPFDVLEMECLEAGTFAASDAHDLRLPTHNLAAAIGQGRRRAPQEGAGGSKHRRLFDVTGGGVTREHRQRMEEAP
jgi:hypothetical protein